MLTIEKFIKTNDELLRNFKIKKGSRKSKIEFKGLFSAVGKKLKSKGITSVDLVRDLREGR